MQIADAIIPGYEEDIAGFNPLLMVKDFDADGEIRTDTTFMTTADVPSLAMEGIITDPVNPYTGKRITGDEKQNLQYVSFSHDYEPEKNHGTTFTESPWYIVTPGGDTLFDLSRWIPQEEEQ